MSQWSDFFNGYGQKSNPVQTTITSSEFDSTNEQQQGLGQFGNQLGSNSNSYRAGITIDQINNRIIINDGTNNRIVLGKIS